MMVTIQNEVLSATINALGTELKSLKNLETGFEYIWQADPAYWNRSAPILFPIVGEVKNGVIKVDGKTYPLSRHGFARDNRFRVHRYTENEVAFVLESNEETLKMFPYPFLFLVSYKLEGNQLVTTFTIENVSTDTLCFSVGAHPAFNLSAENLEDYFIEFEEPETLSRHLLKDNLFSGEMETVVNNSKIMGLSAALFDNDAVVFKNPVSKKLSLKSKSGDYALTMDFKGFSYFGIWTKPGCHKFLCLEPWCGLADNANFGGEFKDKEGVIRLLAGEVFERQFAIDITN